MRIGLIGTGRIGSFHAGVLARHPEVESLVVADADAARAAGSRARWARWRPRTSRRCSGTPWTPW